MNHFERQLPFGPELSFSFYGKKRSPNAVKPSSPIMQMQPNLLREREYKHRKTTTQMNNQHDTGNNHAPEQLEFVFPAETQNAVRVTIISLWTRRSHGPMAPCIYSITIPADRTVAKMLGYAYYLTNVDGRPMARSFCATTSGDLMVLGGIHYLVAARGFHQLSDVQARREIEIADSWEWGKWSLRTLQEKLQSGVPIIDDPGR